MEQLVSAPFTGHIVKDLSHLLRSETGQPTFSNYTNQSQQPMDRAIPTHIIQWMDSLGETEDG